MLFPYVFMSLGHQDLEQGISAGAGQRCRFLPCRGPTLIPARVLSFLLQHTCCSRLHACPVAQSCLTVCDPMMDCQASLSMEFSRQEYWSGLPFPPPGDLPSPGIEPVSLASSALHTGSLPLHHLGSPSYRILFLSGCVQVNLKINCDSNKKR